MTVSVSNTNLNDSFNSWRLNTNFAATVISNNVVTVARDGSANRGGVAKGNGHVAGTFTANELRTTTLKAGNTSADGGFLFINSNTSINATSLTVTAVTGGSQGQFLRIEGESDTPNFKSLTLRDISDLSSNSADIILSGSNSTFSDNGDSPAIKFADTNGNSARIFMAADVAGDADLHVVLADAAGDSTFAITDSSNNIVGSIDSAGNIVATTAFLPDSDDSVDLGSSGLEFKDAYIDGVAYIDELSLATGAGQGVATSLIPKTDAVGNLGSTNRKWGTLFADTTNGGAGVFNTLGVSGTLTVNGAVTFNSDLTLNGDNLTLDGNTVIGDQSTDTVSFNAQVDSHFDPQTGSQQDMGDTSNRWHNVYANNVVANNVVTDNNLTVLGDLSVSGTTTISSGQAFTADDGTFTTLTVDGQADFDGDVNLGNATTDSITVTGQFDSNLIPITDDTFDVTNSITNDGTVMLGKNGKLHANNTITNGTLTSAMLANTMTSGSTVGNSTAIPVLSFNNKGQVTGFGTSSVSGVTGVTYTKANNTVRVSTSTTNYDAVISAATANTTTAGTTDRGVASFDSGDFSVSSGLVSLKNATSGAVLAINGTANEVNVSRSNGTVTVGLPDDVTIGGQLNVSENIIVSGNLVVQGTTTTVNSETVNIADNKIVLNSNYSDSTPTEDAGIVVERGTKANYEFIWDESEKSWSTSDRNLIANNFVGNVTGNLDGTAELANTAVKLQSSRKIGAKLIGDITGQANVSFDGTGNAQAVITTTYNNDVVSAGDGIDVSHTAGEGSTATVSLEKASTSNLGGAIFDANNFTVTASGLARIKDNGIALGTETTGNYVAGITAGQGINTTGTSSGEGIAHTISVEPDQRGDIQTVGLSKTYYFADAVFGNRFYVEVGGSANEIARLTDTSADFEGSVVAFSSTVSDERLKENIEQVTDAVSKVQQLNGYTFNYKKDGREGAGVIAQEVQEVLPSAVKEHAVLNGDGEYLIVEYDQLTALLIESIKELKAEIDDLKKNK